PRKSTADAETSSLGYLLVSFLNVGPTGQFISWGCALSRLRFASWGCALSRFRFASVHRFAAFLNGQWPVPPRSRFPACPAPRPARFRYGRRRHLGHLAIA